MSRASRNIAGWLGKDWVIQSGTHFVPDIKKTPKEKERHQGEDGAWIRHQKMGITEEEI